MDEVRTQNSKKTRDFTDLHKIGRRKEETVRRQPLTVSLLLMGLRKEALSPLPICDRTKGNRLLLRSSWASMKYSKLNRCATICTAGGR